MGNLRQKYTDEEWDKLQDNVTKKDETYPSSSKNSFTKLEVAQLLQRQRYLCAVSIQNALPESLKDVLKSMIMNSPEPENWNKQNG